MTRHVSSQKGPGRDPYNRSARFGVGHPNSAVRIAGPMPKLSLPESVITLDMDGTMYDPWGCCGIKGNFGASKTCDHHRPDTIAQVRELMASTGASPVVLSWRAGLHRITGEWLAKIDFPVAAIFTPGSPHDVAGACLHTAYFAKKHWGNSSQAAYKAAVVATLIARYQVKVVGAFEDNTTVCDSFRRLRVPDVRQVPRLVEVSDHDFRAGYIGAPKPGAVRTTMPGPARRASSQRSLWDEYRPDTYYPGDPFGSSADDLRWDADDTLCGDADTGGALLCAPHLRVGDQVNFYLGGNSHFGEVLGGEDGFVVVVSDTETIEYLRPSEARRI